MSSAASRLEKIQGEVWIILGIIAGLLMAYLFVYGNARVDFRIVLFIVGMSSVFPIIAHADRRVHVDDPPEGEMDDVARIGMGNDRKN